MIKKQTKITATVSINTSINSLAATKSSDTVYKCLRVSSEVRSDSFRVSAYRSFKNKGKDPIVSPQSVRGRSRGCRLSGMNNNYRLGVCAGVQTEFCEGGRK